jgi:hypothetical protein
MAFPLSEMLFRMKTNINRSQALCIELIEFFDLLLKTVNNNKFMDRKD